MCDPLAEDVGSEMTGALFADFALHHIDTPEATIRARVGGSGPPVLLLHGHPETHMMWHAVAPQLAERHTVVCADLRGYGESSKPPTDDRHEPYSKRAMARDMVFVMGSLGFEAFDVAGHDRGGRVAYRMALDHPDRVTRLAVLDIVPTYEMWRRVDKEFGFVDYHWFFLAQPAPFPETLIASAPEAYYFRNPRPWMHPEALADYRRATSDPATIHAMCEDYRAGATYDDAADQHDLETGVRIACPLHVLWAGREELGRWFDVLTVWRRWVDASVSGRAVDSGHFLAEEAATETAEELRSFFAAR